VSDLPLRFAVALRDAGLDEPLASAVTFTRALGEVGLERRDPVYWAGRATLVRRPEDVAIYDATFGTFWNEARQTLEISGVVLPAAREEEQDDDGASTDSVDGEATEEEIALWSPVEIIRHKDLASCSAEELAEAERLIASLRLTGPLRRSRRLEPDRKIGRLDLRRTVRDALRSGGEPVTLSWQATGERRRRVVLLVDVSGSMEPYARALLRFAHVAVATRRGMEVFALTTRLTRLTNALATHDPDLAVAAATAAIPDLEGGTRLGETIAEFADRWGVRGMARGAVVVVLSDGWDRGDPAVLGEHMARLARVAHRVVWVNPLKASAGYAPLAGGMAAALPFVDEFVEGHSVASLDALAKVIAA
jgi:uncharacterized protein with von Willebrand factor type A (vWA) domain